MSRYGDRFPDMLLPGLDKIPNRSGDPTDGGCTIHRSVHGGAGTTNLSTKRFHQWREFPTMVTLPTFQQFWDARGAENSQDPDISKLIGDWASGGDLGGHLASGRGGDLTFPVNCSEVTIAILNALISCLRRIGVNSP